MLTRANGERTVVVVSDNASDMHNNAVAQVLQLLVDLGVVDSALLLYLPAHHAKHEADGAHGRVTSALRDTDVLTLDHLAALVDDLPGLRALIVNPAAFADVAKWLRARNPNPIPNIMQYSLMWAHVRFRGMLLLKREADDKPWYSWPMREGPMEAGQLESMERLPAREPTRAAVGVVKALGAQCCNLPGHMGFAGLWQRSHLSVWDPDSMECASDAFMSRAANVKSLPERWEALQHWGGVERAPLLSTPADAWLPIVDLVSDACSLRYHGFTDARLPPGSEEAWMGPLLRWVASSHSRRAAVDAVAVDEAPVHAWVPQPQHPELEHFMRGLLQPSLAYLDEVLASATPAPAVLPPLQGGALRLTPAQKQHAAEVADRHASPMSEASE